MQRGHPETSDSSEGAEVNGEEEKKKKKKKKEKKHKRHKSTETGSEVRIYRLSSYVRAHVVRACAMYLRGQ